MTGVVRASILEHFAKRSNNRDISLKDEDSPVLSISPGTFLHVACVHECKMSSTTSYPVARALLHLFRTGEQSRQRWQDLRPCFGVRHSAPDWDQKG
eukprot:4559407-Amphidinium_carterae.1